MGHRINPFVRCQRGLVFLIHWQATSINWDQERRKKVDFRVVSGLRCRKTKSR